MPFDTPTPAPLLRPALLMRAARAGLPAYRRDPVLRRLIGAVPPPAEALQHLSEIEARHEAARRARSATYSPARHLDALIALIAERQAGSPPA